MRETNLDCCVVRDLLPSYLEELTETETSAMVREHIEHYVHILILIFSTISCY